MNLYSKDVNQLIQMMKKHHAWFGSVTAEEAEKILKPYPLYTFLLRTGENDLHYLFSYVKHDRVSHKSIRINTEAAGYYPNGGAGCNPNEIYNTVEPLISEFLGCSQQDLLPLSMELTQAQGF